MTTLRALFAAALVALTFGIAVAKLPAPPPPTDEQKAAAEDKKAKDAAAAEVAKGQQAKAEDRVASRYIAEQKAKGVVVTPQMPAGFARVCRAGEACGRQGCGQGAGSSTRTRRHACRRTRQEVGWRHVRYRDGGFGLHFSLWERSALCRDWPETGIIRGSWGDGRVVEGA